MTKKDFNKDKKIIEKWLGDIDNLNFIRCNNVYGNRYRVDVFTFEQSDNELFSKTKITQSYFLSVKNGKIKDLTKNV